ncbi:MAG: hypothetical protein WAV20_01065 [Blastocatellia bacterium]
MAEYPKQFIDKLDAQCSKEAWPLIGLYILAMVATAAGIYIVGEISNRLF